MSETKQAVYAGIRGTVTFDTVKHELPIPDCVRKEVAEFALAVTKKHQENTRKERSK